MRPARLNCDFAKKVAEGGKKFFPLGRFQGLSLGGGFKDFLFSPLFGEDFQFD